MVDALQAEHREYVASILDTIDSAFSNYFLTMAPRYDHRTIQFVEGSRKRIIIPGNDLWGQDSRVSRITHRG